MKQGIKNKPRQFTDSLLASLSTARKLPEPKKEPNNLNKNFTLRQSLLQFN